MSFWLLALTTAAASLAAAVRIERSEDFDEPICYGPLVLYGRCEED